MAILDSKILSRVSSVFDKEEVNLEQNIGMVSKPKIYWSLPSLVGKHVQVRVPPPTLPSRFKKYLRKRWMTVQA